LGGASLYLNLALPSCQLSSHKATMSCKCCRNILQNYKMQIFNIKKNRIQQYMSEENKSFNCKLFN
jgi:hypothetical protein